MVVNASTNAATFTVTRVNAASTSSSMDPRGALEYDNNAGVTDVSNFTSLTFNYTSTFSALQFDIDLGGKIASKTISASAGGTFTLTAAELDRGALNRSTLYERLSRPMGPRGVSDEAFDEQEAAPSRGGRGQAQAG
jgi:hypothetical protein